MNAKGQHVGRHDDGEGGPYAKLEPHLVGYSQHGEDLIEDRHDECATADTE